MYQQKHKFNQLFITSLSDEYSVNFCEVIVLLLDCNQLFGLHQFWLKNTCLGQVQVSVWKQKSLDFLKKKKEKNILPVSYLTCSTLNNRCSSNHKIRRHFDPSEAVFRCSFRKIY